VLAVEGIETVGRVLVLVGVRDMVEREVTVEGEAKVDRVVITDREDVAEELDAVELCVWIVVLFSGIEELKPIVEFSAGSWEP
jgi:hypothetical protein